MISKKSKCPSRASVLLRSLLAHRQNHNGPVCMQAANNETPNNGSSNTFNDICDYSDDLASALLSFGKPLKQTGRPMIRL